jgi:hypothetical protein
MASTLEEESGEASAGFRALEPGTWISAIAFSLHFTIYRFRDILDGFEKKRCPTRLSKGADRFGARSVCQIRLAGPGGEAPESSRGLPTPGALLDELGFPTRGLNCGLDWPLSGKNQTPSLWFLDRSDGKRVRQQLWQSDRRRKRPMVPGAKSRRRVKERSSANTCRDLLVRFPERVTDEATRSRAQIAFGGLASLRCRVP